MYIRICEVSPRFNGLCLSPSSCIHFPVYDHLSRLASSWTAIKARNKNTSIVSSLVGTSLLVVDSTKKSSLGKGFRSPVGNGVYLETEVVWHTQYNLSLWKSIWHESIVAVRESSWQWWGCISLEVGFNAWCLSAGWRGWVKSFLVTNLSLFHRSDETKWWKALSLKTLATLTSGQERLKPERLVSPPSSRWLFTILF